MKKNLDPQTILQLAVNARKDMAVARKSGYPDDCRAHARTMDQMVIQYAALTGEPVSRVLAEVRRLASN